MTANKTKATHIAWAANHRGYTVSVLNVNETVYEYNGGNCPWESTSYIDPADKDAIPLKRLRQYAKQTARELAEEYGLAEIRIEENTDLLDDEGAGEIK